MDLENPPQIEREEQVPKFFPEVKTKYTEEPYYYQKGIDMNLITADAVCVADSVNARDNHRVINAIKEKVNSLSSNEVRTRESQFVGFNVYDQGRKVTEFEWDSKSENNMVVAIFQRHLSSRVTPEFNVVEQLGYSWNR